MCPDGGRSVSAALTTTQNRINAETARQPGLL